MTGTSANGRVRVHGSDGELAETISQPDGWQVNQMYLDEMTHFLDCVRRGVPTMNPLGDGMEALEIALAARRPENAVP